MNDIIAYQKQDVNPDIKKSIERIINEMGHYGDSCDGFGGDSLMFTPLSPERAEKFNNSFVQKWRQTRTVYNVDVYDGQTKSGYCKWKFYTRIAVDTEALRERKWEEHRKKMLEGNCPCCCRGEF